MIISALFLWLALVFSSVFIYRAVCTAIYEFSGPREKEPADRKFPIAIPATAAIWAWVGYALF